MIKSAPTGVVLLIFLRHMEYCFFQGKVPNSLRGCRPHLVWSKERSRQGSSNMVMAGSGIQSEDLLEGRFMTLSLKASEKAKDID